MDEISILLDFVSNNAFAMVVCLYTIVVNNKTVRENTEAVNKMVLLLEHMTGGVKHE